MTDLLTGQRMGRPSLYTPELAERICDLLCDGWTVAEIAELPDMPHRSQIHRWAYSHPDFRDMYRRAQLIKVDVYVDEVIDIADDSRNDWLERQDGRTGKTKLVLNREVLQRAKLRINARKWAASILNPKKYGDRITNADDPENPAQGNDQGWMRVYVEPDPPPETSALPQQRLLPGGDPEQPN